MPENKWLAFGSWFKTERERAGVSQGVVAKNTPIHVIQLSRIENGHSGVKPDTLERLVAAVNKISTGHRIDLGTAMRRAGFFVPDGKNEGLFSGLDSLTPEKQKLARRQIRAIIDTLVEEDDLDTDYIEEEE